MKKCVKCKKTKCKDAFPKKLKSIGSLCKLCSGLWQTEYRKNYPWKTTLAHIKQRCTNPKNQDYYRYGGRGIECRITEEELKELWFRDKAFDMSQPTIDRIDNDGNYEYNNCQYIENKNNTIKAHNKTVIQYTIDGSYIKSWGSVKEARESLNICKISCVALGKRKTAGGFKWRYDE